MANGSVSAQKKNLRIFQTRYIFVPGPSKGCFLETFKYTKITKRHPLEGAGDVFFNVIFNRIGNIDIIAGMHIACMYNISIVCYHRNHRSTRIGVGYSGHSRLQATHMATLEKVH